MLKEVKEKPTSGQFVEMWENDGKIWASTLKYDTYGHLCIHIPENGWRRKGVSLSTVKPRYFQQNKPPKGIKPRMIHILDRITEIQDAIARYEAIELEYPDAWGDELSALCADFPGE